MATTPLETAQLSDFDRLVLALKTAIVMNNPDESGAGGIVNLNEALDALFWTAADFLVQTGNVTTPRDARLEGEEIGKRMAKILKALLAAKAEGRESDMQPTPIGNPN